MVDNSEMMSAPIPGMSLTTEPGNRPWENPPKMVEVEEVIEHYIPRLADDARADQLMTLLEQGVAVNFLVDSMLTTGTMKGLHTMESGMLAAPVLAEVVMGMAEIEGIDYTESYAPLREKKPSQAVVNRAMELIEKEESPFADAKLEEEEQQTQDTKPKARRAIAIVATPAEPEVMEQEVTEDGI